MPATVSQKGAGGICWLQKTVWQKIFIISKIFRFWSGVWIVHKFIYLIIYHIHNCLYAYLNIEGKKIIKETDDKNTASSKVTWKLVWLNLILFLSSNVARVLNKCHTVALLVVYISSSVHIFIIPSPSSFWGLQGIKEKSIIGAVSISIFTEQTV